MNAGLFLAVLATLQLGSARDTLIRCDNLGSFNSESLTKSR